MIPLAFLFLATLVLLSSTCLAVPASTGWGWSQFVPAPGYVTTTFPVQQNASLLAYIDDTYDAPKIERAVIQIHGQGRDFWNYARTNTKARSLAASTMGLDASTVLSIAPEFLAIGDLAAGSFSASDGYLCWDASEWSGGQDNIANCTAGVTGVSAFTALDSILSWLQNSTQFPALNTIVVSGHSQGGHMVHRYASFGGNRGSDQVDVQYWVGNPASYLYLTPQRPTNASQLKACPDYNVYEMGLDQLATYESYAAPAPTATQLWATYISNPVHIALGLADAGSGDLGCEALVQGKSHLDRGIGYMNFVQNWAGSLPSKHTIDYFPGITHNANNMLTQPNSLRRLFFDRGDKITPSQAPNGMTNGVQDVFITSPPNAALTNFTVEAASTPILLSRVSLPGTSSSSSSSSTTSSASNTTTNSNSPGNAALAKQDSHSASSASSLCSSTSFIPLSLFTASVALYHLYM